MALVLDYDAKTRQIYVTAHRALEDTSATAIQEAYLLASDDPSVKPEIHTYLNSQSRVSVSLDSTRATDTPHATTSEPERGRATPDTRAPTDAIRGTRSRGRVRPVYPTKSLGRRPVRSRSGSYSRPREAKPDSRPATPTCEEEEVEVLLKTKKKYKPVALKVNPTPT